MSNHITVTEDDIKSSEFKPRIGHGDLQNLYQHVKTQWPKGYRAHYLSMRIERALSWLEQAERSAEERDYFLAFIAYWIAYNSLYGKYQPNKKSVPEKERREYKIQKDFHRKISGCGSGEGLREISEVLKEKKAVIEGIVCHDFLSRLHWDYLHFELYGHDATEEEEWQRSAKWKKRLDKDKKKLDALLDRLEADPGDTGAVKKILDLLFPDRIYTLRNQVFHGGSVRGKITSFGEVSAEKKGYTNISQVSRSVKIMVFLIPLFIKVVMENPEKGLWSSPNSPVIDRGDARLRQ